MKFRSAYQSIKANVVALFTRAWIEMVYVDTLIGDLTMVALFTRAWIEMFILSPLPRRARVALFTRAWIEITAKQLFQA